MALLSKVVFGIVAGAVLWVLHQWIGRYPPPLPRSRDRGRELQEVLLLWLVAVAVPIVRIHAVAPWLERALPDRTLRELVNVPLLSLAYLVLPLIVIVQRHGWSAADLGLVWRVQSKGVAAFAVAFGVLSGCVPFLTGQAVMGFDPLPAGEFLLLVYTNSFLEEFYHRGVIQSKLERALGQGRAVLWGGILFGLTHVAFDISRLLTTQGVIAVALAVLLQSMAGWLFGIIYMKTRSLWPGIVCHYTINWLSAILAGLLQ
jgi:CAAX protease family protein